MEPVSLFHDDQDHGHLGSGLKLRSFISEGLHHPPAHKQHCATATGDCVQSKVESMKSDADTGSLLATEEPKQCGKKHGNVPGGSAISGPLSGITYVLSSTEDVTPTAYEAAREDLDDNEGTGMCFEGCVISSSPLSTHVEQETRLEYENTYLESLDERDGMLIESVPVSSPASFFHSDTIHDSKDRSLVGHADTWRDLPSSQQEAENQTSCTESDISEKRTADYIFPKEVIEGTLTNDRIMGQHVGVKNTEFDELSIPGPAHADRNIEVMNHSEQNRETHGSLLRDTITRVDLCLRSVLSDPITGAFLDDAMVAHCGHSFGSGSLQKVMETHICITCGATASPNSLVPNFALRAAVLAYKHDDQLQMTSIRGLKRRREVSEQVEGSEAKRTERDPWGSAENFPMDNFRSKAIQFPFAVSNKVLIKGNKRTPDRFVGREAVITTQCLNGWYLVRTLDTGESVRLQYRSLQKLGDLEMPCNSETEYFSEQGGDGSGSPVELLQGPTKVAANRGLESGSASQREAANGKFGLDEKTNTSCSPERDLIQPPYASKSLRDGCGVNKLICGVTPNISVEDLLSNQGRNIEHRFIEEGLKIFEVSTAQHPDIEICVAAVVQAVPDAVVEKFRTDLLNGVSTFHDESGDEQTAQDGPQSETNSRIWAGVTTDFLVTDPLNDPSGDATGVGCRTGNTDQENENELLRTRSKRTSQHSRSSLPSGVRRQDSDPYRKVYSSGYRRRSGKGDTVPTVSVNAADLGQRSIRSYSETLHGGGLGCGKHGKDMKVKSTTEILQIMRKDMLKLEKQIPRYFLLDGWTSDRISWRKAVKSSCTVLELGKAVREFRYALLLTAAGGMTDEELDKHLTTISETEDVDLLVSLWGRLYSDVYNCVESRPKNFSSLAHSLWRKLLTVEAKDVSELDLNSTSQRMSPGQMKTATTTTAADESCQQNSGSNVKTLLASTMSLLQKQSRMELMSVKEALEQEKRHIMAKLVKLEESYAKLGSTPSLENSLTSSKPSGEGSNGQPPHRISMPRKKKYCPGDPLGLSTPDDETDEGESDTASPEQDADGEATDLSDSD